MAHFVGNFNFSRLIGMKVLDANIDGKDVKGLFIPIQDNDIQQWKGEWRLWFRAFAYREPKTKFSHFLMKYIPIKDIKRMSSAQIEAFSKHHIGGMMKSDYVKETNVVESEDDFITENL